MASDFVQRMLSSAVETEDWAVIVGLGDPAAQLAQVTRDGVVAPSRVQVEPNSKVCPVPADRVGGQEWVDDLLRTLAALEGSGRPRSRAPPARPSEKLPIAPLPTEKSWAGRVGRPTRSLQGPPILRSGSLQHSTLRPRDCQRPCRAPSICARDLSPRVSASTPQIGCAPRTVPGAARSPCEATRLH
jgi:hypothetical protein